MNQGKLVLHNSSASSVDHFSPLRRTYHGEFKVQSFSCLDQFCA